MEPQACPRRVHEPGPWNTTEKPLDLWVPKETRWFVQCTCPRRYSNKGVETLGLNEDCPEHGQKFFPPLGRTCSFCGCIHPEDAIELIEKHNYVFEHCGSYKPYKGYITKDQKSHIPPIKAYRMHFTVDQWSKLMENHK